MLDDNWPGEQVGLGWKMYDWTKIKSGLVIAKTDSDHFHSLKLWQ